ncbi:MAG: O-antigen ligase family protein [Bacillota bacterium]
MRELADIKQAASAWRARVGGEGRVDHVLRLLVGAVVVLFPAACLLVDRSDSLSLLLLLVIGLTVWARNGFKAGLTRREWLFVSVFALFFLAGVIAFESGLQTDSGFRLLGRYLRLLMVFPALVAFKRYRPPALLVWTGLGLGALVLGLDAIRESVAGNGFLRPDGDTNVAILFGDLATLTTFMFAAGYVYIDERLPRLGPKLVALCILAGLLACFLSGTRGAWLTLPVLLILFLSCRHMLPPRAVLVAALTVLALFVALYLLPQTHVRDRLKAAASQWDVYGQVTSSFAHSGPPPLCMDDPALLQAWADVGVQQTPGVLKFEVKPQKNWRKVSLRRRGCTRFQALEITNNTDAVARVWLPRSRRPGPGPVTTRWLVTGNTTLKFGNGAHYLHPLNERFFKTVDMGAPRRYADGVTVTVRPHHYVRVVPVESFVGEYRYALLQTSVGQRLEMWAVAWQMFARSPLTGVGTGAYMTEAQNMVDAGEAPVITAVYDHPHSEYLDALSSRGLLGLMAVLALLGVPAWLFSRAIASPDPARMGAGLGGLLAAVGFGMFGLTETMFIHSVTIGWYVIMTAVFMALTEAPTRRENGKG